MPDDLLRMLEEMDKSATEAPWYGPRLAIMATTYGQGSLISGPRSQGIIEAVGYLSQPVEADLELIRALRNSLPALLDVLRAADAMRGYNEAHGETCNCTRCLVSAAYDAGRDRFAQAIKEGRG